MATALNKIIRRELQIDDRRYTVTISPDAVRITEKGHRKGHQLTWRSLLSGEAELTTALQQSLRSSTPRRQSAHADASAATDETRQR